MGGTTPSPKAKAKDKDKESSRSASGSTGAASAASASVRITAAAYFTVLLHAFKHTHKPVCGVLLASSPKNAQTDRVVVDSVVPISHAPLVVPDMVQIALQQVKIYLEETGKVAVGIYYGDEYAAGSSPPTLAASPQLKVAAQMVQELGCHPSALFQLDTRKLVQHQNIALVPVYSSGSIALHSPPSMLSKLRDALPLNIDLYDWDDHLSDLRRDWLANTSVWDALDRLVGA